MLTKAGNNYSNLSLKDLLDARDQDHLSLMKKKNVVATALGRYRIRLQDIDDNGNYKGASSDSERTLQNSAVIDISWPCVLVFVSEWETKGKLLHVKEGGVNMIPNSIILRDGREVPICVVKAEKSDMPVEPVDSFSLKFPRTMIGGGYPLIVNGQGITHIASTGCIVSDGHTYYALTNKHAAGKTGEEIYSKFGADEARVGVSSGKALGKVKFTDLYEGWVGEDILVNCDAGLIKIDDVNIWKTEILGLGEIGPLYDLNSYNLGVDIITTHTVKKGKKEATNSVVKAYGAVSKEMQGEIVGLFYRYKSVGGKEYVCDFLIGGRDGEQLPTHHGDSGTVWLYEQADEQGNKIDMPFALHWGQHTFIEDDKTNSYTYAMASNITNICRELDVEIVRGWNAETDYSWAKTGHYKIAARACDLVSNDKLTKLLANNKSLIGYSDDDLQNKTGIVKARSGEFIPLADVADLFWRDKRFKTEGSNHFADMDEVTDGANNNKSLLDLCFTGKKPNLDYVDIDKWISYYNDSDKVDPKTKVDSKTKEEKPAPREGALPFRVWEIYCLMVEALQQDDSKKALDEFICLGGTLSHYVGDACQPLHISYLHHGYPDKPEQMPVHAVYEEKMIDANMAVLFAGVNKIKKTVKDADLFTGGQGSAAHVISLMRDTFNTLSPDEIITSFLNHEGRTRAKDMWADVGDQTIDVIGKGCYAMAVIWQSAWIEAGADSKFKVKDLIARDQDDLIALYSDYKFAQSYKLRDKPFKQTLK